jgi:hypothetical protein
MLNSEHFIFTLHSRTFAAFADWLLAGMPDADVFNCKTENGNVALCALLSTLSRIKMAADSLTASAT